MAREERPAPRGAWSRAFVGWARRIRQPSAIALLLLCAAGAVRVGIASSDHGLYWPDEVFQSLEPAHRMVFGFGFVPWEYQVGARSWVLPGVLALLMKAAAAAGVSTGVGLAAVAKVAMAVFTTLGLWGSVRLARALAGWSGALFALLLGAAFPLSLVLGHRALSETATAPLLVWAAVWTLERRDRSALLAGALSALSVALRPQNVIVLAGLGLLLLLGKRLRSAALFAAAATAIGLLAGGLLDWITWGAPFHSLLVNVRFNLVEGKAARYGVEAWSFYVTALGSAIGPALFLMVAGLVSVARRAAALLAIAVVYLVVHSCVPHKELRFLMPVAPIAIALAGAGLAVVAERLERRRRGPPAREERRASAAPSRPVRMAPALVLGGIACLLMAAQAARMTFADVGESRAPWSKGSVWSARDGVNRLLSRAGAQPDLCGLLLVNYGQIVYSGGYTYLHRDVPFVGIDALDPVNPIRLLDIGFANYVIAPRSLGIVEGFTPVAERGDAVLLRRDGACDPPPSGFTQLFPRD
jgi:hypothetical protein